MTDARLAQRRDQRGRVITQMVAHHDAAHEPPVHADEDLCPADALILVEIARRGVRIAVVSAPSEP